MSKAFTKEDDNWEDPEIKRDPLADIPSGARNYMTPRGARALRDELDALVRVERPRLLGMISRLDRGGLGAAGGAVRDARKSLRRVNGRISFLTQRLAVTEIVDPLERRGDIVLFGATVTVLPETGRENVENVENVYRIVGIDETDVGRGRISWTSPLARAMLNRREGDVVKASTPSGEEELEIIHVRYCEIS